MSGTLEDSNALLTGMDDPIAGAQVSALSVDGVPLAGEAAVSNASGQFALCVTGQEFATEVTATGYVTTYLEDLALTQSATVPGIPITESGNVAAYAVVLEGFDTQDAMVIAEVTSTSGQPPCNDVSGWVFAAALVDGGALSFGTAYVGADGLPHASLHSTVSTTQGGHSFGIGFLYNLDPSVTNAVLIGATRLDGGNGCWVNDGGPFTGRVAIAQSAFSFTPLLLP